MLSLTTFVAVSLLVTAANSLTKPSFAVDGEARVALREIPTVLKTEQNLICKDCNENENRTLAFLQTQGIKDRNAIAAVMGNIRQESNFTSNVCEGGHKTSYAGCRVGGYGLIQFTSANRFRGLGRHAQLIKKDPSTIDAQLSYIVTEPQWKRIVNSLKTPGKSIKRYMGYTYSWIGWSTKGARASYAYAYANKLDLVQVPVNHSLPDG